MNHCLRLLLLITTVFSVQSLASPKWQWELVEAQGKPVARHEAGLVAYEDKLILLGGRRVNPTSIFDTKTGKWSNKSAPPIEIHHFQAVVVDKAIYLVGAMTGPWPFEKPLDRVLIYYPEEDKFEYSHTIPKERRRGGAGAVYHNGKIYLVGGITRGHMEGYKPWLDEYDPKTGKWRVLTDAPHPRDHFHAVVANNQLFAFAGRKTSRKTKQDIQLTISLGDVYDFDKQQWLKNDKRRELPTLRAGNGAFTWKDEVIIGGGESHGKALAHNEIEAFNSKSMQWRDWPSLNTGRHGTGFVIIGDYVYTVSGCGKPGGEPELHSIERLRLPK